MSRHNVFAYTDLETVYPQYISVNVEEDDKVTITVRSAAWGDGTCGDTATIKLEPEQLSKLAHTLFSFACTNGA